MKAKINKNSRRAYPEMWEHREGRRRIGIFGVLACVTGLAMVVGSYAGYKALCKWDFFMVTGVQIEGCGRISKNEFLELSGVDVFMNILALNAHEVEEKIGKHEWIEKVSVERQWPNQLIIKIQEKKPVALANIGGEYFYLDRSGRAFAKIVGNDDLDYPVVSGMDAGDWQEGEKLACLREALSFIGRAGHKQNTTLPQQNISEIHVEADGNMILFLASRPFPIYLGKGSISDQYGGLVKVLSRLYQEDKFVSISYIRMDYQPGKVLVGLAEAVS
jgi:cell division protein FtsQ